jgi:hypothetical protein
MTQAASEAQGEIGAACSSTQFVVGSRGQMWGDVAVMSSALIVSAFLSRAVRLHSATATAVALLVIAAGLIAWLFVRQLLRGERGWMFYTAMLLFSILPDRGDLLVAAAVTPAWIATLALLAAAPAVVGLVGAVRIVQALDEMWRQINYRALAFAFIATLTAVLAQWLLSRLGVDLLTWRVLLLLMVALWGAGMAWGYWRLR